MHRYLQMYSSEHRGFKALLLCSLSFGFFLMYLDQSYNIVLNKIPRPFAIKDAIDGGDETAPVILADIPNLSELLTQKSSIIKIEDSKPDHLLLEEQNHLKKILIWHYAYGNKSMGFGFGRKPFLDGGCRESRCLMTDNRNLVPVQEFDAILFHFRGLDPNSLPRKRSVKQRYIFYEMESASWLFEDPSKFNKIFNWTMTYRKDSDIWSRYGAVVPKPPDSPESTIPSKNYAQGKTHLAAWFVSNCRSMSNREALVEDIQKMIPVDIYGKCGPFKCSRKHETKCHKMLEKKYKFYFSFENSLCKDYATEKLYGILKLNIIPVVFGYANYKEFAPPNSYINVLDFNDTRSLVDYLLFLDKNDTAYNEYFKWKEKYSTVSVKDLRNEGYCDLCHKLHTDTKPKIYEDMLEWFVKKGNCKRLLPVSWMEYLVGFLLS